MINGCKFMNLHPLNPLNCLAHILSKFSLLDVVLKFLFLKKADIQKRILILSIIVGNMLGWENVGFVADNQT